MMCNIYQTHLLLEPCTGVQDTYVFNLNCVSALVQLPPSYSSFFRTTDLFDIAFCGLDFSIFLALFTTENSHSSVCAKTHRKMRIPSEKYTRKYNDRKNQLFCVFAVRNNFSVGVTRTEKLCSARLKIKFLCIIPHRKKKNPTEKLFFLLVLSRQSCIGALT